MGLSTLSKDDRRPAGFENYAEIGDGCDVEGRLIARLYECANGKPWCLCTRLDCWIHRSETCAMLACACSATLNHWMADAVLTS